MNKPVPRDLAQSVRARLLNLSRERREEFEGLAVRYALERLLHRLGRSEYRRQFILKGALLFPLWGSEPYRPTRDLDLLGSGEPSVAHLEQVFRDLCRMPVEEDGLRFQPDTVSGELIREDQVYEGVRIRLVAGLAGAILRLQVDIGFGDVVTPAPEEVDYPAILGFPAPRLRIYPRETVVAEKLQAMVALGIANSRMKDFYDVWVLARRFTFEGDLLSQAIEATFARRGTPLPAGPPVALTPKFSQDKDKRTQWTAFVRRSRLETTSIDFADVVTILRDFVLPPVLSLARGEAFNMIWASAPPWQKRLLETTERGGESAVRPADAGGS